MTTDIQRIMSTDPLDLVRSDIDEIIKTYRSMRNQFNAGDKQAGATKRLTPKQKEVTEAAGTLDLSSLGLKK